MMPRSPFATVFLAPALMLIVMTGCGSDASADDEDSGDAAVVDHSAFDAILDKYVDERGLVDYAGIRDEAGEKLDAYLATLAKVDPETLERDERLAYYLNLYNAEVIDEVLNNYAAGYSVSDDDFKFFSEPYVKTATKTMSLDELEKKVIVPEFDEPRIHAAVVCAAMSCPPLLDEAYAADKLEQQLEERTRTWLNRDDLNRFDPDTKTASLSMIFNWYADDFGGADELDEWVDPYVEPATTGWTVEHLDYDWTLNDSK